MSGDKPWREWSAIPDWPLPEDTGLEDDIEHMDTFGTTEMQALGIADLGDYES